MKIYVVGGSIRDGFLGKESNDIDYCVVGATPDDMFDKGFKQVGKDFPVFLDEKGEEYALARTERKAGNGYNGFETYYGQDVTIEDDLKRRDLTINAIAMDKEGDIVDPYGGVNDLRNKALKHVSEDFADDPLRVLRVARFKAKLPDFTIEDETKDLMRILVDEGELDHLTPERIFLETKKALKEEKPSEYFKTLQEVGALERIFPEIHKLVGVEQPPQHHPEVDSFVHTMMTLDIATQLSDDPVIRFGALVHDLGKGITPKEELPRHIGHEKNGVPIVEDMCNRLKFPKEYKQIGMKSSKYHLKVHRVEDMSARKIVRVLGELAVDKEKQREDFNKVLVVCEADARGRGGRENDPYPQKDIFKNFADKYSSVSMKNVMKEQDIDSIDKNNVEKMKMFLYNKRISIIKKEQKTSKDYTYSM
jgi:tRNA nucleotidyltransferase (CCA-adding enzyme)